MILFNDFTYWLYKERIKGIRLSEKFFSFHKVIIDEQQFLYDIILLN